MPRTTRFRQGLGHTRWATHGGVTTANAHPHLDCAGRVVVVHNGIVENHVELRGRLEASGHRFCSETDSEVVAHLVEERLGQGESLPAALDAVFLQLAGFNAVVVMDTRDHQFAAAKRVSPLVIGLGQHHSLIASDAIALHEHVTGLVFLEDNQLAVLSEQGVDFIDRTRRVHIAPNVIAPFAH